MPRYAVFAFDDYYPSGGWLDHKRSFYTLGEAQIKFNEFKHQSDKFKHAQLFKFDHAQLVDLQESKIVEEF